MEISFSLPARRIEVSNCAQHPRNWDDAVLARHPLPDGLGHLDRLLEAERCKLLQQADIKALATLPSLNSLRGKIIGLLQAPASRMVGVLAAPGGQIARVMKAKAEKG